MFRKRLDSAAGGMYTCTHAHNIHHALEDSRCCAAVPLSAIAPGRTTAAVCLGRGMSATIQWRGVAGRACRSCASCVGSQRHPNVLAIIQGTVGELATGTWHGGGWLGNCFTLSDPQDSLDSWLETLRSVYGKRAAACDRAERRNLTWIIRELSIAGKVFEASAAKVADNTCLVAT